MKAIAFAIMFAAAIGKADFEAIDKVSQLFQAWLVMITLVGFVFNILFEKNK